MSDVDDGRAAGADLEGDEVDEAQAGPREGEECLLLWPARVRVLLNPMVWAGVILAFGIGSCFVGLLVTFVTRSAIGLLIGAGLFGFFVALFVAIGIVVDLFGGFRVTFALTTEGVWSVSGKVAGAASDAAIVGGLLTGGAAAVGAGLLARSEKSTFISYPEVTKVKVSARRRSLLVKGGFGDKPIGLMCTPDNFEPALAILHERCPQARFVGRSVPI